jgi:hypothetical protein
VSNVEAKRDCRKKKDQSMSNPNIFKTQIAHSLGSAGSFSEIVVLYIIYSSTIPYSWFQCVHYHCQLSIESMV